MSSTKTCAHCAEEIKAEARLCPHCGRNPVAGSQYVWIAWAVGAALVAFLIFSYVQAGRDAERFVDEIRQGS